MNCHIFLKILESIMTIRKLLYYMNPLLYLQQLSEAIHEK